MTTATPGRNFYDEQIRLLREGDTDRLNDLHYHEDAVLVSFANVVRGADELKQYFSSYMSQLGSLQVLSLDQFVETDGALLFEATVRTRLGEARVYDAFVLRDGKATHHFAGLK
jgi:ketosteroid isomerase-like protein